MRASRSFNPPIVKENIDNDSDQEASSSSPSRPLSNRRRGLEKKAQFKGFQNAFTQSASVVKSPVKSVHNPSLSSATGSKILDQDAFVHNDDTMLIDQEGGVFESPVREFAAEPPPDPSSAEVRTSPLEEVRPLKTVRINLSYRIMVSFNAQFSRMSLLIPTTLPCIHYFPSRFQQLILHRTLTKYMLLLVVFF